MTYKHVLSGLIDHKKLQCTYIYIVIFMFNSLMELYHLEKPNNYAVFFLNNNIYNMNVCLMNYIQTYRCHVPFKNPLSWPHAICILYNAQVFTFKHRECNLCRSFLVILQRFTFKWWTHTNSDLLWKAQA